jgi:hypothetical protein
MHAQRFDFTMRKLTPTSRWDIPERQRAFANPDQPENIQAQDAGDFPDLALAPLLHDDAQPGAIRAALQHFDPGTAGDLSIRQTNPATPLP